MGHKQYRVGRLHPRFLRFLSPGNGGTEGGVKTIGESGALLAGETER